MQSDSMTLMAGGRGPARPLPLVALLCLLVLQAVGLPTAHAGQSGSTPGLPAGFDPVEEYLLEARAARQAGRLNDALDVLTRAAAEIPEDFDSDLLLWRGRVLNDLGRFAEALEVLERLGSLDRGRGSAARLERVRSLRGAGRNPEAEGILRTLLESYPRCGPARVQLVDLLVAQERGLEAQRELDSLLAQAPGLAWAVALKARLAARAGQVDAALTLLREQLDADDAQQSLRAVLVELLIESNRPREAWIESKILIEDSKDPLRYELAARAALAADEPFDAFAALVQALRIAPERTSTLDSLMVVLTRSDDVRDQIALQRAGARPEDPVGWVQAMEARLGMGRPRDAIALYESLDPEIQQDPEARLVLAEGLRGIQDFTRALSVIEPLCTELPGTRPIPLAAWFERALIEVELGRNESALMSFRKAAVGDLAPEAHFNRALVLRGLRRDAEAERALVEAVGVLDAFPEAWKELGAVRWSSLGKKSEAITAYLKYLELSGGDPAVEALLEREGVPLGSR